MRRITVLAATFVCVTAAPTALAQLATWMGGNGNWTDPNWMINGMPSTIPNGAQVTANIPLGAVGLDTGMSFSVGGVTLTGSGFLSGHGLLTVSGGLIQDAGTMGASVVLTGQGSTWTGGSWGSSSNRFTTVDPGAALQISVSGIANLTRRELVNNGAVTHLNGRLGGIEANPPGNATSIVNNGTWTESTVFALEFFALDPTHTWVFTNNGTFTKSGSGSTTFTQVLFDSVGSVDVQGGTLNLNQGGTSGATATFHAEPGAAINFGGVGPAYTVNGSVFTGGGQFTATNALRMSGTVTASNLTLDGASIAGSHTLSVPSFFWTGDNIGSFGGAGGTTLDAATSLDIDITGVVNLIARSLANNGAVTRRGGSIGGNFLTSVVNNGTWTESAGVPLEFLALDPTHNWTYTNNGTFTKQGPQSTTFSIRFNNAGSVAVQDGTLNAARSFTQTAGEMLLSGGDLAGVLTFTGGSLRGSGNLAGNVTMTGATLDPGLSAGLLSFGSNLTLSGASVPIELEGTTRGTTYDAIDVAGSLSLGGSALQLDVSLLDPATPVGAEFLIFDKGSAPAISGTFTGLSQGARFTSGIFEFEITYLGGDGNDIVLTVTASSFCYADCDPNGVLDIFDFLCFQDSFVAGEPYACDCDPDPVCNIFDFLCFQSAFVAGCP